MVTNNNYGWKLYPFIGDVEAPQVLNSIKNRTDVLLVRGDNGCNVFSFVWLGFWSGMVETRAMFFFFHFKVVRLM